MGRVQLGAGTKRFPPCITPCSAVRRYFGQIHRPGCSPRSQGVAGKAPESAASLRFRSYLGHPSLWFGFTPRSLRRCDEKNADVRTRYPDTFKGPTPVAGGEIDRSRALTWRIGVPHRDHQPGGPWGVTDAGPLFGRRGCTGHPFSIGLAPASGCPGKVVHDHPSVHLNGQRSDGVGEVTVNGSTGTAAAWSTAQVLMGSKGEERRVNRQQTVNGLKRESPKPLDFLGISATYLRTGRDSNPRPPP